MSMESANQVWLVIRGIVQGAEAEGFEEVVLGDRGRSGKVGDGPCDFQEAVVAAHGETEGLHGLANEPLAGIVLRRESGNVRLPHDAVGLSCSSILDLALCAALNSC